MNTDKPKQRYALISVSNKEGIVRLAEAFLQHNIGIISTGGTAKHLRKHGVALQEVEAITGFPEMMDGRLKTLHPKIHGGILHIRGNVGHEALVANHEMPTIDFVVVNLYPFAETAAKKGVKPAEVIENIDIGGPAMIRSAAKNHASVTVLTEPICYGAAVMLLLENNGTIPLRNRVEYAKAAFAYTAAYDQTISKWIEEHENDLVPD
jgi:phosphoribosylaminoimidazolecarboxamide formyltransferase/IMP cyclohydrolase